MLSPVEEIKQRLDLVDLIKEYVPLRAAGANWKARCPFHNEKSPSFMVSRDKGIWHCFGCGQGGDIFTFVQEIEGMDFPEALRLLAKRAGVELKSYDPKLTTQRTKIIDLLRWVSRYYHEVLHKSSEAESARAYLTTRGVTAGTIDDFLLGFAPSGPEATLQALRKKGFAEDDIFQAGLTIKRERGTGFYDRFRGRIMFPIADVHGTVVGFSGRILESLLDPNKPVPAKYINSPQTLVYNKSAVLFALDQAKAAIKKEGRAILVEGQMDCLASHQAGVTNVVAVSGTALTREQVQLLKRFTNTVVIALDQDAAGLNATVRGVEQAMREKMDIKVVRLPFGKDPDELIRRDPAAWKTAVAAAEPVMDYFFAEATKNRDVTKIDDKKEVARALLPILGRLADPIEQTHYLQQLGDLLRVDETALRASLPKPAGDREPKPSGRRPAEARPLDRYRAISERLLALLLREPAWLAQVTAQMDPEVLSGDDLQALYKTVVVWYTQQQAQTPADMTTAAAGLDTDQRELADLLFLLGDKEFAAASEAERQHELLTMIGALKRHHLGRELEQLEREVRHLEQQPDAGQSPQLAAVLERVHAVTTQIRELS